MTCLPHLLLSNRICHLAVEKPTLFLVNCVPYMCRLNRKHKCRLTFFTPSPQRLHFLFPHWISRKLCYLSGFLCPPLPGYLLPSIALRINTRVPPIFPKLPHSVFLLIGPHQHYHISLSIHSNMTVHHHVYLHLPLLDICPFII